VYDKYSVKNPVAIAKFKSFIPKAPKTSCWDWTGALNPYGYGDFYFEYESFIASRLSYSVFVAPIPHGLCVCHKCDNRKCVNPSHLFLGTKGDNNRDTVLRKRHQTQRGSRSNFAKFNEQQVINIREMHLNGRSINSIAKQFNSGRTGISFIVNRKTWKHL
jgi:hypothetical protein